MPTTNESRDIAEDESILRFSRGRLSRGRGLRKTTGCSTCRKRHVKCDEVKPVCGGCSKTRKTCIYENGQKVRKVSHIPNIIENGRNHVQIEAGASSEARKTLEQACVERQAMVTRSRAHERSQENFHPTPSFTNISSHINEESHSPFNPDVNPVGQDNVLNSTFVDSLPPADNRLSPQGASTISSSHNVENATARWVDLLFQDAIIQNEDIRNMNFESEGFNIFGNSVAQSPIDLPELNGSCNEDGIVLSTLSSNPCLRERNLILEQDQTLEKQSWQSESPITILPHEHIAFRNFVQHISGWMDLFDQSRSFAVHVPHLAVHNVGLMNAILALSVRYMSLSANMNGMHEHAQSDALQYYYKTLHYIQKAMQYDTYKTSLELIATSLIISTYEMLDGSSQDWERHLHGVFWIQRSQVIHGDSKGLRQAVWWAWLCQDVFAAYLEKRKPFTFWRPARNLDELDPLELAARSVYYFSQVVGYCSSEEAEAGRLNPFSRIAKRDTLRENLQQWEKHLTIEFKALPLPQMEKETFEPLWIHPPAFGVAIQLFHASNILLSLHCPVPGDFQMYASLRKSIKESIRIICGVAMSLNDFASSVLCSQCLFIAGLPLENSEQRRVVLDLLGRCRMQAGWPVRSLKDRLVSIWESMD